MSRIGITYPFEDYVRAYRTMRDVAILTSPLWGLMLLAHLRRSG